MMEPYIWLKCMETLGWKGRGGRKSAFLVWVGYYIITLVKQYFSLTGMNSNASTFLLLIMTVYILCTTILLFQGTIFKKIASDGVFLLSIIATEGLSMVILSKCLSVPAEEFMKLGFWSAVGTGFAKVLLSIVCYFIFRRKKLKKILFDSTGVLMVVIAYGIYGLIELNLYFHFEELRNNLSLFLWQLLGQMVVIIGGVIFVYTLTKNKEQLRKVTEELEYNKKIATVTNQLENLRHDMKFHGRLMQQYLQKGEYDKLKEYIEHVFSSVGAAENIFVLKDDSVAMALTAIAQEAEKKKIEFSHIIAVEDFLLPPEDACSLFSNILKNAVEAAEQVEETDETKPFICLEVSPIDSGYRINCINSSAVKPNYKDGKLQTTKKDKTRHGRGISIIEEIVKRNGGTVDTMFHDNFFEINCTICTKGGRR